MAKLSLLLILVYLVSTLDTSRGSCTEVEIVCNFEEYVLRSKYTNWLAVVGVKLKSARVGLLEEQNALRGAIVLLDEHLDTYGRGRLTDLVEIKAIYLLSKDALIGYLGENGPRLAASFDAVETHIVKNEVKLGNLKRVLSEVVDSIGNWESTVTNISVALTSWDLCVRTRQIGANRCGFNEITGGLENLACLTTKISKTLAVLLRTLQDCSKAVTRIHDTLGVVEHLYNVVAKSVSLQLPRLLGIWLKSELNLANLMEKLIGETKTATKQLVTTAHYSFNDALLLTRCSSDGASLPTTTRQTTAPPVMSTSTSTEPTSASLCQCTKDLDIVIALDVSGQIDELDFQIAKFTIYNLLDYFMVGRNKTRVGFLAYSDQVDTYFHLNNSLDVVEMKRIIANVKLKGGPSIAEKILRSMIDVEFQISSGDRPLSDNSGLVFTKNGTGNEIMARDLANQLRMRATMFSVGVSSDIGNYILTVIPSRPENLIQMHGRDFSTMSLVRTICDADNTLMTSTTTTPTTTTTTPTTTTTTPTTTTTTPTTTTTTPTTTTTTPTTTTTTPTTTTTTPTTTTTTPTTTTTTPTTTTTTLTTTTTTPTTTTTTPTTTTTTPTTTTTTPTTTTTTPTTTTTTPTTTTTTPTTTTTTPTTTTTTPTTTTTTPTTTTTTPTTTTTTPTTTTTTPTTTTTTPTTTTTTPTTTTTTPTTTTTTPTTTTTTPTTTTTTPTTTTTTPTTTTTTPTTTTTTPTTTTTTPTTTTTTPTTTTTTPTTTTTTPTTTTTTPTTTTTTPTTTTTTPTTTTTTTTTPTTTTTTPTTTTTTPTKTTTTPTTKTTTPTQKPTTPIITTTPMTTTTTATTPKTKLTTSTTMHTASTTPNKTTTTPTATTTMPVGTTTTPIATTPTTTTTKPATTTKPINVTIPTTATSTTTATTNIPHTSTTTPTNATSTTTSTNLTITITTSTTATNLTTTNTPTTTSFVTPAGCIRNNTRWLFDLFIVLDVSDEIENEDFIEAKSRIVNLLDYFVIGRNDTRVGFFTYSDKVYPQFSLNNNLTVDEMKNIIDNVTKVGGQSVAENALTRLMEVEYREKNGDRPNVENAGIVFTKKATGNEFVTLQLAIKLKMQVNMFTVAITNILTNYILYVIPSIPQNFLHMKNATFSERVIADMICDETQPETDTLEKPTLICDLDLTIVVDTFDGFISPKQFQRSKQFIKDFINLPYILLGTTRIALISYSSTARVIKWMGTERTKMWINNKINSLEQSSSGSAAENGLSKLYQSYSASKGDRLAVKNAAIVFTSRATGDMRSTLLLALRLKARNIDLYSMNSGSFMSNYVLHVIAGRPQNVLTVKNTTPIDLLRRLCT